MSVVIKTEQELRHYVNEADIVLCQIRFADSETWIKIAKKEVRDQILPSLPEPSHMYGCTYGEYHPETKILYLG